MQPDQIARVVLAFVVALCLIGLLAYARGEPGNDDRDPEPPTSAAAVLASRKKRVRCSSVGGAVPSDNMSFRATRRSSVPSEAR